MANNNYRFYTRSFPALRFEDTLFGKSYDDFQKAIDMIFLLADTKSGQRNFVKPMNIIINESESQVIITLNFDKAIVTQTIVAKAMLIFKDDDNIEEKIQKSLFMEYGMNAECFIHFNKSFFLSSLNWLIKQFNKSPDFRERIKNIEGKAISEEVIDCCERAIEGMNKSKSILGGNGMWINPIFKARELVVDTNMCFCVLPFNSKRLELFDEVIKPSLENKFDLTVIRSGKISAPNLDIRENIWTYINKAAFIIADLSDYNANVYYELGICHTLGKKVITLCDEDSLEKDYGGKLPFDVSTINTIIYKNSGAGPKKLVDDIEKNVKALRSGEDYIE